MLVGLKGLVQLLTTSVFLGSTFTPSLEKRDQESNRSQLKFALTIFGIELVILEDLQNYPQMMHMITLTLRVYQDVINKYKHKHIKITSKNSIYKVHESLHESRRGIC